MWAICKGYCATSNEWHICPLGPIRTFFWFWTILRFILQTFHFHEENNKVGPARSRFDGYLALKSWLRKLYVLLNLRLLGGGLQWSWPNCGIIFSRSCGSHHVTHDCRVEQCETTKAQALWHKYFFVWCFWWVSVSYDSLKLNWFCLNRKGLPDTQMT